MNSTQEIGYQDCVLLVEQGRWAAAEKGLLLLIQRQSPKLSYLNLLGICQASTGRYVEALETLRGAATAYPKSAEILHNMGPVYRTLGKFDEAEQCYRRAIQLKPDYAEAYFNLVAAYKVKVDDSIINDIDMLLRRSDLTDADRSFLNFAAGKIYDDIGDYDKAFQHFQLGNKLRGEQYSPAEFQEETSRILSAFTQETIATLTGSGIDTNIPIFVVGMPRSGTTLVEQILASHPDVFGAGELPDFASIAATISKHDPQRRPFPEYFDTLAPQIIRGFAQAYLQRIRSINGTAARIVDKMPRNFRFIGLIAVMFPNARIIHCRRHPLDTCLSCYCQRFRNGHPYTGDLNHLGLYYRNYQTQMDHWHKLFPSRIMDVEYEHLVSDPEHLTRKMLDFCGLAWNDACLKPHETTRAVTTASNLQVRQPIYRSSMERWRHYRKHLGPLIDALGWNESPET